MKIKSSLKLEITYNIEKCIRCYVQKNVQTKIDSLQISWLAELRQTSIIFIKLSSLQYVPDEKLDLKLINEALCSMQEIIFKFEGMVRK